MLPILVFLFIVFLIAIQDNGDDNGIDKDVPDQEGLEDLDNVEYFRQRRSPTGKRRN